MQLQPRYGNDPIIVLEGSSGEVAEPSVRQHRRLAAAVEQFGDEEWAQPSRCDGWTSKDVISHLETANNFWAFAIKEGLRGEPSQFLATFDPVATPASLVSATEDDPAGEVLERFRRSTDALEELFTSLDADDWSTLAEAPPGHVTIGALAHHALWDSWVHERDILLPLGIVPDQEPDEIAACLRYAVALGPAFAISNGHDGRGVMAIDVADPSVSLFVEIGDRVVVRDGEATADLRLTGDAVELLESLSIRQPFVQEIPAASSWMLRGLSEVFDVAG